MPVAFLKKRDIVYSMKQKHNSQIALLLAVISLAGYFFPIGGIILAIIAIVFGRRGLAASPDKHVAITAIILGTVSLIAWTVMQIYLLSTFSVG